MALTHHEQWDGTGYPNGLKGEEIPCPGQIMAIADVYDSLTSGRHYKEGISHKKAVEIILAKRGSQFDPQLIDAFMEIHALFRAIAEQFADDSVTETLQVGNGLRVKAGHEPILIRNLFHRREGSKGEASKIYEPTIS